MPCTGIGRGTAIDETVPSFDYTSWLRAIQGAPRTGHFLSVARAGSFCKDVGSLYTLLRDGK